MSVSRITSKPKVAKWRKSPKAGRKYQFIYHLLPHPQGNRRASLLTNKALFMYCVVVSGFLLLFRIAPVYFPDVLGYATDIRTSELLRYTNEKRAELGLGPLKLNASLAEAARKKAEHMFRHSYWAHIAPDGTEPWDFILGESYDYVYAGENLAKNFSESQEVVDAWYNSPSHQENLLSPRYQEVGFAIVDGKLNGYETTLVVQMFGVLRQPLSAAIPTTSDKGTAKVNTANTEKSEMVVVETAPVSQPELVAGSGAPPEDLTGESAQPQIEETEKVVKPMIDIRTASKGMSVVFAGFLSSLFALDYWYSLKKGLVRVTGHTLVHLSFLVLAVAGIWFVLNPGRVL